MEPTLENISDYDTLKGEKKKVVYAVIIIGLVIGAVIAVLGGVYGHPKDSIGVSEKIKAMPVK